MGVKNMGEKKKEEFIAEKIVKRGMPAIY